MQEQKKGQNTELKICCISGCSNMPRTKCK